jgi:putative ATPase
MQLLEHAKANDVVLKERNIEVSEFEALIRYSGGDARKFLNIIDLMVNATPEGETVLIDNKSIAEKLQMNPAAYDKGGEMHYDIISAFIKSIRGSDPDAALYWLARMIEGGEDPKFIARRLIISASEDIGLANPNALLLANAAFDAVQKIGWPEGRIPLAEATVYLATSEKSNSAYNGINQALDYVRSTGNLTIPLHLRNAPTQMMRDMGYADGYIYPHDYPQHFAPQDYMPREAQGMRFWVPADNSGEARAAQRMESYWGKKKG